MQVALNQVPYIIKNDPYQDDQLRSLVGVDLKRSQPDYFFIKIVLDRPKKQKRFEDDYEDYFFTNLYIKSR
jgi:hypothetical protein